jgi:prepilin-type N-terminal cleavage/methylation domain-containing protein
MRNQKGFTLVEIMMVVIIIGILAVLGIPRYQKYILESKLSEVQVNFGEIKQGMAKYYNAHGQKYRPIAGVTDMEKYLRIELGAKTNFDYTIGTYGDTADQNNRGYVVKAKLTAAGAKEFNKAEGLCLWYVFPMENRPRDTSTGDFLEKWEKGWNDMEFFDDSLAPEAEKIDSVNDPAGNTMAVKWPS